MDNRDLLAQMIAQNKTRIFRIDFLPVYEGFPSDYKDYNVMTIIGIKKRTPVGDDRLCMLSFKDNKEYIVPHEDITAINIRKFQLRA